MKTTPVFLPGKFHVQRNLAGCSPESHKESNKTKHTYTLQETVLPERFSFLPVFQIPSKNFTCGRLNNMFQGEKVVHRKAQWSKFMDDIQDIHECTCQATS